MIMWSHKMLYWTMGIAASLLGLWAGYTQLYENTLGQPEYEVLSRSDGIEFRQYQPFVIASTTPKQDGKTGLSSGFRVLAGYIFGGNQPGESLAMTAPVLQQNEPGESLPMTAPVLQGADDMRMAFVMPANRSLTDLPTPNSDAVELSEVAWGEVAAIRFAGRGKQERFQQAENTLRTALETQGRTAKGAALYAQYNSPGAFPPLRRNEVLIPLAPRQ
jgi:hypothetical protein